MSRQDSVDVLQKVSALSRAEVSKLRSQLKHCLGLLPLDEEGPVALPNTLHTSSVSFPEDDPFYIPSPTAVLAYSAAVRLGRALEGFIGSMLGADDDGYGGDAQQSSSSVVSPGVKSTPTAASSAWAGKGRERGGIGNDTSPPPSLLTGRPQIASYIIDKTFDDHKVMLRRQLADARAEIDRLKGGDVTAKALQTAEEESAQLRAQLEACQQQREDLTAALEHSQSMRREAMLSLRGLSRAALAWHQRMLMILISTFTACEEWRDWQLEAFLSSRVSAPLPPPTPSPPPLSKQPSLPSILNPRQSKSVATPTPPLTTTTTTLTTRGPLAECVVIIQPSTTAPAVAYGEGASRVGKAVIHPRVGGRDSKGHSKGHTTAPPIVAHLAK